MNEKELFRVYKYPLSDKVELPVGATVISAVSKADGVFIYAEVPVEIVGTEMRRFAIVPTGEAFDPDYKVFIGTVVVDNYYTYHIYEDLTPNI